MVDQEMLSAISDLLEEKLQPIYGRLDNLEEDMHYVRVEQLENNVMPWLDNLEEDMHYVREEQLENNVLPRLDNLEGDMRYVRVEQLENNVMPRLDNLEGDMRYVRVVQLENGVIPKLNTIEACYLDTSERYIKRTEQIDEMAADIVVLKSVVSNHSETLQQMQG